MDNPYLLFQNILDIFPCARESVSAAVLSGGPGQKAGQEQRCNFHWNCKLQCKKGPVEVTVFIPVPLEFHFTTNEKNVLLVPLVVPNIHGFCMEKFKFQF